MRNLTAGTASAKIQGEKVWREIRHPLTGKLIGKLCPQTRQLEVIDRGKRGVIQLPPE